MADSRIIEEFRERVIQSLEENDHNKSYLIDKMDEYSKKSNGHFFSKMLELFVHLSFEEEDAVKHWENVFQNYKYLQSNVKRKFGLRVAMFDYFINLNQMLSNPILVEIHLFQEKEKLAMIDSLTGLFNRRYFDIVIKKELKRSLRYDKSLSIIIVDLDDFKIVNDSKGHLFGDEVLRELGKFFQKYSREEDIICRYGGEEFIIILPETTGDGALNYSERLRENLKTIPLFKKNKITFSGGIASFPTEGTTTEKLLSKADKALYAAKYSGKDCILIDSPEKRLYKRYKKSWKIYYHLIEDVFSDKVIGESFTQDISLGGIRLETNKELGIDSKLMLRIKLPEEDDIDAIGKVVWIKKVDEGVFSYGIKFFDINTEQLEKMKKILPAIYNVPE